MDDILLMLDEKERGRMVGFRIYKGVRILSTITWINLYYLTSTIYY